MSRLIRDTDIIRKLNNLIEAIEAEPRNARYDKMGLLKIVGAIIGAVEGIDEAYDVEAVITELCKETDGFARVYIEDAIRIVERGGRNE